MDYNDIVSVDRLYNKCYISRGYDYSVPRRISSMVVYRGNFSGLIPCIKNVFDKSSRPSNVEMLIRIDDDQKDLYDDLSKDGYINSHNIKIYSGERYGYINLHKYHNDLVRLSVGDILFFIPPSVEIISNGWDDDILSCAVGVSIVRNIQYQEKNGLIYEYPASNFLPFFTRSFLDILGRWSPTTYMDIYINNLSLMSGIQVESNVKIVHHKGVQVYYGPEKNKMVYNGMDHLSSEKIQHEILLDVNKIVKYLEENNIKRNILPYIHLGYNTHKSWFGIINSKDIPTVEIGGGIRSDYFVEFIDKESQSVLFSHMVSPFRHICYNQRVTVPRENIIVRVSSQEDGVFYEKDIEVINYEEGDWRDVVKDNIKDISFDFRNGAKIEILGDGYNNLYSLDFIHRKSGEVLYRGIIPLSGFAKSNREFYTEWLLRVKSENRIISECVFSPTGKRFLMYFIDESFEDAEEWLYYVNKFRVKHRCEVFVSTHWNEKFIGRYRNLKFVSSNDGIENIYAEYSIGRFDNRDKSPRDWRDISVGQICSDILGVEYEEKRCSLIENNGLFVIGAWADTSEKLNILKNTISRCRSVCDDDILLVTHFPVPQEIQNLVNYYIYDKENPLIFRNEFEKYGIERNDSWWYDCPSYRIDLFIQYLHDYAIWTSFRNAFNFAEYLGKENIYYIEFDTQFDPLVFKEEFVLPMSEYDACLKSYSISKKDHSHYNTGIFSLKTAHAAMMSNLLLSKNQFYSSYQDKTFEDIFYSCLSTVADSKKILYLDNSREDNLGLSTCLRKEKIKKAKSDMSVIFCVDDNNFCYILTSFIRVHGSAKISVKYNKSEEVFTVYEKDCRSEDESYFCLLGLDYLSNIRYTLEIKENDSVVFSKDAEYVSISCMSGKIKFKNDNDKKNIRILGQN